MTDGKLIIRQASAADISQIVAFQIGMAQETENKALDPQVVEEGVRVLLHQPGKGQYFLAVIESRVVGSL